MIIDLHWLKIAQWFPNEESEIHYKHCWKDLHDVFKDYDPAWLAYELLNESGSHVEGYWNGFVANSIDMVRSWGGNERNRLIICGCDSGNDVSACSTMELPKSDPNLVLNFHSYYPTYFTFYKSGFDDDYGFAGYDGPVHYPGRVVTDAELAKLSPDQYARTHWFRSSSFDYYSMRSHLKAAYDAGIRLGKRVYCGEYGAQELSGINDRIAWFRDRARIYDEFDMAYATWFGLANTENHPDANKDIIKAVTGKDI